MEIEHDSLDYLFAQMGTLFPVERGMKCDRQSNLMRLVAHDIPDCLRDILDRDPRTAGYRVRGCPGMSGTWCNVMYISFIESNKSSKHVTVPFGVFPCYLISLDGQSVYLTYIIPTRLKSERYLINAVRHIQALFDLPGFDTDVAKLEGIADRHNYHLGTIFFKKYDLSNLPSERDLISDLTVLLDFNNRNNESIDSLL